MTPTLTPVGEYLATSYDPDREYVDGVVEERHVCEYDHANLQTALPRGSPPSTGTSTERRPSP